MRGRKLLIVTDGKAGHENQSKAFCNALGRRYDLLHVAYPTPFKKALSYAADRVGVLTESLFTVEAKPRKNMYDAVVCTGSTAFYPGKVLANRLNVPVCAILYPKGFRLNFDCILAPAFDNPPKRPNIVSMPVNLSPTTQEYYRDCVKAFEQRYTQQKPAVGVIIGGPNPHATMEVDAMKRQLDRLFELTGSYEHWVTTSRRTPKEIETLVDGYPFQYKLLYSSDTFNPIPAFVTLCDRLFVTADSTGMISEAVTQGKAKVEVIMNLKSSGSKFMRLVKDLESLKVVHVFDGSLGFASNKIDLGPAFEEVKRILLPAQYDRQARKGTAAKKKGQVSAVPGAPKPTAKPVVKPTAKPSPKAGAKPSPKKTAKPRKANTQPGKKV